MRLALAVVILAATHIPATAVAACGVNGISGAVVADGPTNGSVAVASCS